MEYDPCYMNIRIHGLCVNPFVFFFIVVCGLLVAGGMFAPSAFAEEDLFETLQIGRFDEPVDAPDFSLPLVGGGEAKLSDYKDKVVLLNFWATWCPYCRTERAALQTTYEKYKEQGFVVLSVSIDRDGIETVQKFVEEHGISFPNMHDQTSKVASEYGVRRVPSTYFILTNGKAVGGVIGPREWDSKDVHRLIEQLLSD